MQDEVLVPGVELLESMRSVGYSFESAIADLVDNSITAKAKRVDIVGDPVEAKFVTITDDGDGMDPATARAALRLAGSVGNGVRDSQDLGRFGLGLKTASLSQARQLTVVTRKSGVTTALQWDIDHVKATGQWSLQVLDDVELEGIPGIEAFSGRDAGTLVVWRNLDYLLGRAEDAGGVMAERLSGLREHLSLTFHRFLEGRTAERLRISVNGVLVPSLDPFLLANPKTQRTPLERIVVDGHKIEATAFTLPHASGMTAKDRKRADLGVDMREAQGFYVYRNRRLISHGHWYGLAKRDELTKQARIRVDLPNTLDHLWQLDIKKSRAEPPQVFKTHLRRILSGVIAKSKRVHTFRGRRETDVEIVRMWQKIVDRDGYRYEVNKEHPLVLALSENIDAESKVTLARLLADLSATFPVSDLYVHAAQNDHPVQATADVDDVRARLRGLRDTHAFAGAPDQIVKVLAAIEPFDRVNDLETLVDAVWKEDS
ncbi:hypothetical protein ACVWYS_002835 [Arthrobacter sp. TE12231]